MTTMQAMEVQGHEGGASLKLVSRAVPRPGWGEILVRVRATSLNYRDLVMARNAKQKVPYVPLSDGAGEVVQVGEGVENFSVGERVTGNFFQSWHSGSMEAETFNSAMGGAIDGMLAQYVVLQARTTLKIPDYLSYEAGATLPCAAVTAWNALVEVAQVRAGQSIVLLGTGGVSVFALQFGRMLGARVIITSSSDEKLARAREMGAHETINYRATPDWSARVRELTSGVGADCVLEVGGAGTLESSLRATRVGGTVALIGVLSGANTIDPMPILYKVLNLRGVYVGSSQMFAQMLRAMELHRIEPVIDRVFDWQDAAEAFQYQESGAHLGKIVLRLS